MNTLAMIDRRYIVDRQGKEAVLYAGLLDLAHRQGLRAIRTRLVQAPAEGNGWMAIVWAEVTAETGTYTGIGDANPQNVGRMVALHTVRMAETRAKARALRDCLNIGGVCLEELGPEPDRVRGTR